MRKTNYIVHIDLMMRTEKEQSLRNDRCMSVNASFYMHVVPRLQCINRTNENLVVKILILFGMCCE